MVDFMVASVIIWTIHKPQGTLYPAPGLVVVTMRGLCSQQSLLETTISILRGARHPTSLIFTPKLTGMPFGHSLCRGIR